MDKASKTLLKGLLVVLTLALSKELLLNLNEIDEMMLVSAMTALTLIFSSERSVDTIKDVTGVKHKINESLIADPVLAENFFTTIQSTLPLLTPKETDVLSFMAKGLMNNEIAKKLGVSESIVRSYLSSILRKLNTNLTTNTVVKTLRNGFANVINALDFYPSHKGSTCFYKPILCQEGWCSDCFIYREKGNESSTLFTSS